MRQTHVKHALTIPRPDSAEVARVGFAELEALGDLLGDLDRDEWRRTTASSWSVHEMVAHVVGQKAESARPWTIPGKIKKARREFAGMSSLDAHNALQITDYGPMSSSELVRRLAEVGRRAVRSGRRTPQFVRRLDTRRYFPEEALIDSTLGYVIDILSNRDTWMHRLEIARATGRPFVTGAHDESVVAQVIRDLAEEWDGPALVLELDRGGQWQLGEGEPVAWARAGTLDYLWHLSGRPGSPDPEVTGDPAAAEALQAARVVF